MSAAAPMDAAAKLRKVDEIVDSLDNVYDQQVRVFTVCPREKRCCAWIFSILYWWWHRTGSEWNWMRRRCCITRNIWCHMQQPTVRYDVWFWDRIGVLYASLMCFYLQLRISEWRRKYSKLKELSPPSSEDIRTWHQFEFLSLQGTLLRLQYVMWSPVKVCGILRTN